MHVYWHGGNLYYYDLCTHWFSLHKDAAYQRRRCGNRRNRPCTTREKSKSITIMFVDVNYTFKHSSFRNRLNFQAASIVMHVVCLQSYLGYGIFVNFRRFRAIWDLNKHRAHRGYNTIFSQSSPFIDRNQ